MPEPLPLADDPKARSAPPPKLTEGDVLDLLRQRHVKPGNGGAGEYAFMTHVRNGAGFDSSRTFDAVVMNLWPSRGLALHVYEVKCSRNDWLRELKQPAKAEAAGRIAEFFSVVVSDEAIVKEGELPPTWGLLAVRGSKLVCLKEAPPLHDLTGLKLKPLARGLVVAMLRAGGAVPVAVAEEVKEADRAGYLRGLEAGRSTEEMHEEQIRNLRQRIADFERASGLAINSWSSMAKDPAEVGAAVRAVLNGESRVEAVKVSIADAAARLRQSADALDKILSAGP